MGILIVIQFLITMLFYPMRVGACGHISLAYDKLEFDVKVLGWSVARLRIKKCDDKFKLLINGKERKPKKKISISNVINIAKQYKIEGVKLKGSLLAMVSLEDAMSTAIMCAAIGGVLQPIFKNLNIFTASPSDTLEIDGRVKMKINIMQLINMIFASLRGENG